MGSRIDASLVLDELTTALWRRQPKKSATVHSDHGGQFTGHEWKDFLRDHNLVSNTSRLATCHDNTLGKSSFQGLKRERIRCQTHPTQDHARADVFNYIELLSNPERRHGTAGDTLPAEFERRHSQ